jgi:hypothetical protein
LKPNERYTLILALAGFIVAIVTGIVFWLQFREMSRQTSILSTQAEQASKDSIESGRRVEEQLRIAADQARAAHDSVQAIQQQIDISKKVFEASERPYLGVEQITYTKDEPSKAIHATAFLKNFGVNPAERVEIDYLSFVNGQAVGVYGGDDRVIIFPGGLRYLHADFNGIDVATFDVANLFIRVHATYRWQQKKYDYCEDWRYFPKAQKFEEVEACRPKPTGPPGSGQFKP